MTGARRGRLAALGARVAFAGTVLAAVTIGGTGPVAAEPLCLPPEPECASTTTEAPTTTASTTTSTLTTLPPTTTTAFVATTFDPGPAPTQQAVVATTTSTSLEVSTSQNVLVPGDGTEGAESTTTTTLAPTRISNDDTSDAALVALIVGGLVVLAVAVGILTWRYWVATRPPSEPAVGSNHG